MATFVTDEPGFRPAITQQAIEQHAARHDVAAASQQHLIVMTGIVLIGAAIGLAVAEIIKRRWLADRAFDGAATGVRAWHKSKIAATNLKNQVMERADRR